MTELILLGMDGTSLTKIWEEIFFHSSQIILFSCSLLEMFCCSILCFIILRRVSIEFKSGDHAWPGHSFIFSSLKTLLWFFTVFGIIVMLELLETGSRIVIQYFGSQACIQSVIYKYYCFCTFYTDAAPYQHTPTSRFSQLALCSHCVSPGQVHAKHAGPHLV